MTIDKVRKINRLLKRMISEGEKSFIIYPYGSIGGLVDDILKKRFGIEAKYIVDKELSSVNDQIIWWDNIPEEDFINCRLLLCSDNNRIRVEVRENALNYFRINKITDVLSHSMFFDMDEYYEPLHLGVYGVRGGQLEAVHRELYKNKVQGAVAECGVYKGEFADIISQFFPDRKLYLFDTFDGFDDRDLCQVEDGYGSYLYEKWRKEFPLNDASVEMALSNISWRGNSVVYKGWFPESVIGTKAEDEKYAFVSLDTDLYKPILEGLRFFYPRMSPGGVIFVHDYVYESLPGVYEAVYKFCMEQNASYTRSIDNYSAIIFKPY